MAACCPTANGFDRHVGGGGTGARTPRSVQPVARGAGGEPACAVGACVWAELDGRARTAPSAAPSRRSAVGRRQGLTCTTAAPRLDAAEQAGTRPPLLPGGVSQKWRRPSALRRTRLAARWRREARGQQQRARGTHLAGCRPLRAPAVSEALCTVLVPVASAARRPAPRRADAPRAGPDAHGGPRDDESFRQQPLQRRWGGLHTRRRKGCAAAGN